MKKRSISIDGKTIDIWDDITSFAEQSRFYEYALKSKFIVARDVALPENAGLQKTLLCEFSPEEVKQHGVVFVPEIKKYIIDNNLRVARYYVNLGTASDVYAYHVDAYIEGSKTLLYYLNTTWLPNWEGETHFSDRNAREIQASVSFLPGRVVIFDSSIPHKSSQPSFKAEHFRMVLAIKLVPPHSVMYNTSTDIEKI